MMAPLRLARTKGAAAWQLGLRAYMQRRQRLQEPTRRHGLPKASAKRCLSSATGASVELAHSAIASKEDGDPVVFLHGLFGSQMNFRTIGRLVSEKVQRPVILMDMRNHGRSPHVDSMAYADMAGDVAHTLTSVLGIQRASLVGHSMGGKIAMMAALYHPQLVRDLVVVDIAPVSYPLMRDTMHVAQAMKQVPLHSGDIRTRQDADEALKASVTDPIVRRFVLTNFVQGKGANPTPSWRINLDAILHEMRTLSDFPLLPGDARNRDVRAFFLHGNKSNYVLDTHDEVIHSFFPRATRHALDAGHWLHAERQQEFVAEVAAFLDKA